MNRLKLSKLSDRISKFIRQRVPDCRASIVESTTAVRAESTARHSETVLVGGDLFKRSLGVKFAN